jgi:hypothetical protein
MKFLKAGLWIVLVLALVGAGVGIGYRVFHPRNDQTVVTASVVLTALRDRGFFVTQTYVFDEPVTITKTSGSALKDFFFGQTITARGVMEANVGIDLAKITEQNVRIDGDTVTIVLPSASVFNVRPIGPIDVKNTQGVLKRLLEKDTGYNEALAELTKQAEEAAKQPELLERANVRAKEDIERFLRYVVQGKQVVVEVRS